MTLNRSKYIGNKEGENNRKRYQDIGGIEKLEKNKLEGTMSNSFDVKLFLNIPADKPVELRIGHIATLWYGKVLNETSRRRSFDIIEDFFPNLVFNINDSGKAEEPQLSTEDYYIKVWKGNDNKIKQGTSTQEYQIVSRLIGTSDTLKYQKPASLIQKRVASELCTNDIAVKKLRLYYKSVFETLSESQKNCFISVFKTYINTVVNEIGHKNLSPLFPFNPVSILLDLNNYYLYPLLGVEDYADFFLWMNLGALLRNEITLLMNTYYNSFSPRRIEKKELINLEDANVPQYLWDELRKAYNNHQSILLLNPDEVLFPNGFPKIPITERYVVDETKEKTISVIEAINIIKTDYARENILFEGDGGVGKTLTLFDICLDQKSYFYHIPAIYIPLYYLNNITDADAIDIYIRNMYPAAYNYIHKISEQPYEDKPNLVLLLDGINEVSVNNRARIERNIEQWSNYSGIIIIATSRYQQTYENIFVKFSLLELSNDSVLSYLRLCNVSLPAKDSKVWNIIKTPLYLNMYVQTDFMKNETKHISFLNWKEANNCGEIIWNYMQLETYRTIKHRNVEKGSIPANEYAFAICAVAPFIFHAMNIQNKSILTMQEFLSLIDDSILNYTQKFAIPEIVQSVLYDIDHKARIRTSIEDHLDWIYEILVNNSVLFIEKSIGSNISKIFVPLHMVFKDGYTSIYLYNLAHTVMGWKSFQHYPLELQKYQKEFVMQTFAELMSNNELSILIESTKQLENNIYVNAISFLLECYGLKNGYDYKKLDFSYMDLRQVNLCTFKKRNEIKLDFPTAADKYIEAKISGFTFSNPGHSNLIRVVKISRRGDFFISASDDLSIKVWDMYSGACRKTFIGHTDIINDLIITSDDKYIISGSQDGSVRIWNVDDNSCRCLYEDYCSPIQCLGLSDNDNYLAVGTSNRGVLIWKLKPDYEFVAAHYCHLDEVTNIVISKEKNHIISAGNDGVIIIYDFNNMHVKGILRGHSSRIRKLIVSDEAGFFISSSDDDSIKIWDSEVGICLHTLREHVLSITDMKLTNDNHFLVSISMENTICIWDVLRGELLYTIRDDEPKARLKPVGEADKDQNHWPAIVQLSQDSQICICSSENKNLFRFDILTGKPLSNIDTGYFANNISLVPDGTTCISSSLSDNTIHIWDAISGKNYKTIPYNSSSVLAFSLSPAGDESLCLLSDGSIHVCDLKNKRCRYIIYYKETKYSYIGYLSNGSSIILCDLQGTIRIINKLDDYNETTYSTIDLFEKRSISKQQKYLSTFKIVANGDMLTIDKNGSLFFVKKDDVDDVFKKQDETIPYCTALTEIITDSDTYDLVVALNIGDIYLSSKNNLRHNQSLNVSKREITKLFYLNDDKSIIYATGGLSPEIFIYGLENDTISTIPTGSKSKLCKITLSQDKTLLCCGYKNSSILVWDCAFKEYKYYYDVNASAIKVLEITADNRFLLCNKSDYEILVISLPDSTPFSVLKYTVSCFIDIKIIRNTHLCISAHENGELVKWDIETGNIIEVLMKNQSGLDYLNIDLSKAIITSDKDLLRQNGIIIDNEY